MSTPQFGHWTENTKGGLYRAHSTEPSWIAVRKESDGTAEVVSILNGVTENQTYPRIEAL